MSLKEQIDADIKKAMLSKNKDELRALRGIKSMILLAETEKGSGGTLDRSAEMQLLTKAAKQRRESLDIYKSQGRDDLARIEEDEIKIIGRYLPAQLTEQELHAEIKKIIDQAGARGMADMGKVMGIATRTLAGKAEGKAIADAVKKLLNV
jgi:uncharacterized protein